jgi:hypothetical protein
MDLYRKIAFCADLRLLLTAAVPAVKKSSGHLSNVAASASANNHAKIRTAGRIAAASVILPPHWRGF